MKPKVKIQINSIKYKMNKFKVFDVRDKKGTVRTAVLADDIIKLIDVLEKKRKYYELKFKKSEQELIDLQEAYNMAMKEINKLRGKLGYK